MRAAAKLLLRRAIGRGDENGGAGIGSGAGGKCGTITISSGSVGDKNWTDNSARGAGGAAGIGCGKGGSCGTISIGAGITCVSAVMNNGYYSSDYSCIGGKDPDTMTAVSVEVANNLSDSGEGGTYRIIERE